MEQTRPNSDQQSAVEVLHASGCALHNGPALEPGPCDCGALKARIVQTLVRVRLALSASNNVLATDRPDLALAPDTSWTTNHAQEIEAIDRVLDDLGVDPNQPLAVAATQHR